MVTAASIITTAAPSTILRTPSQGTASPVARGRCEILISMSNWPSAPTRGSSALMRWLTADGHDHRRQQQRGTK
jgi:hypothetical protein